MPRRKRRKNRFAISIYVVFAFVYERTTIFGHLLVVDELWRSKIPLLAPIKVPKFNEMKDTTIKNTNWINTQPLPRGKYIQVEGK